VPAGASKYFAAPVDGGFCHLTLRDSHTAAITWHTGDAGAPVNYTVPTWQNPRRS
jgi:hypothetical protein